LINRPEINGERSKYTTQARTIPFAQFGRKRRASVNPSLCEFQFNPWCEISVTHLHSRKLEEGKDLALRLDIRVEPSRWGKQVVEQLLVRDREIEEAITGADGKLLSFPHEGSF